MIAFQTDEAIAPAIAARYHETGVPMIAIDIPHPGATYFGANNYEAGLLAGRYLGKWAKQQWHGQADELLLVSADGRNLTMSGGDQVIVLDRV